MAENEKRVLRLLNHVPMVIFNLMFVLIVLAVYFKNDQQSAINFLFQIYLTCIAVVAIYKRYIVTHLVLSPAEKKRKYVIQTISVFVAGIVMSTVVGMLMPNGDNPPPYALGVLLWVTFALIGIMLVSTSTYTHHFYGQKLEAVQAEADKIKAELQLLKSQINPHFLFNTLNNIYGLVHMSDPRAPEMITRLSKILRYLLYDCGESRVALRKEKELIENYLQLQALKSKSIATRIDFYNDGISDHHTIMPMLLVNFIENCFKHSDIETNQEGWVSIGLEVSGNELHFTTRNTLKPEFQKPTGFGIGLNNTRKMLEGEYGENFNLRVGRIDDFYEIDLKMTLI